MRARILPGLLLATLLAACADEQQDLRAWMEAQRRAIPTQEAPVEPPKRFEPFRYDSTGQADPFAGSRLALTPAGGSGAGARGVAPDLRRRREALEAIPLESIRMVGSLARGGTPYALLQAEGYLHQVRAGNYAGQNFGRIIRVTESEVVLTETVQDAAGDWVPRESTLRLQEGARK